MKRRKPSLLGFAVACCLLLSGVRPALAAEWPGVSTLVDSIMARFDTNGDSKIDTGEWQAGIAGSFREIDADGDGKITAAEIDALGDEIGKEAGETAGALLIKIIKPIILAMDADGDGSVSREEFAHAANAIFEKLDDDKNSELTRGELLRLPMKLLAPNAK